MEIHILIFVPDIRQNLTKVNPAAVAMIRLEVSIKDGTKMMSKEADVPAREYIHRNEMDKNKKRITS